MNPTPDALDRSEWGEAGCVHYRDIIVIAASAGGVAALCQLCRELPRSLPAAVFVVLHIGAHDSQLPNILARSGQLQALHPTDGEPIVPGRIYVAPPNCHMLLDGSCIRLTHGPKEHHTRPAADPLFRSAALSHGPRTIGVVLTGHLDDGTAGMQAIKACGGLAVVQDPQEAEAPDMPASALANVAIDHCVALAQMAPTLVALTAQPLTLERLTPAAQLVLEHRVSLQEGHAMNELDSLGQPSPMVCPECTGTLWEIRDSRPPRYRCHTGHAYSLQSLWYQQSTVVEAALWSAVRALQDQEAMLRKMADLALAEGRATPAADHLADADQVNAQAALVQQLAERNVNHPARQKTKQQNTKQQSPTPQDPTAQTIGTS